MLLKFIVDDQKLIRVDKNKPFNKTKKVLKAQFKFSHLWRGFTKIVEVRYRDKSRILMCREEADNIVEIPAEALAYKRFEISVYSGENVRLTTNPVMVHLGSSGHHDNPSIGPDIEITSDVLEILLSDAYKFFAYAEIIGNDLIFYNKANKIISKIELDENGFYTKDVLDNLLDQKADKNDVIDIEEDLDLIKSSIRGKADKDSVYSREEIDALLENIDVSDSGLLSISKVKDYLFEAHYDKLNYTKANIYFKNKQAEVPIAGCSSVRQGNFYGRNLDWFYSEQADIIVHTPRVGGHYANIGVASSISTLTNEFLSSGQYTLIQVNERKYNNVKY